VRARSGAFVAACRAVGAAAAFTGVVLLFVVDRGGPGELVYFTTQSNLLVGCCLLWGALVRWLPAGPPPALRGAVTLYIMVTFLVFHIVLANPASGFGDGSMHFGSIRNVLLHTVTPLLALVDWVLVRVGRLRWRWAVGWLTYPLAYLAFVLVRGAIGYGYPYPFLDAGSLGYGAVAVVALALLVVFSLLGLLVIAVGRAASRVQAPAAEPGAP
jgi:hypothetical protein